MEPLRTPEARFDGLPGFPYDPGYVETPSGRMAYVETGAGDETFLCLHGEPTWSYLYRKLMPVLAERGRVVVPDFVGFGRSDKLPDPGDYSFAQQYEALATFVRALDLDGVTLVCQDWGGILGLRAAARMPDRFARLVPMNTGLPDGTRRMSDVWHQFRELVETVPDLQVGTLVDSGCATDLDDAVVAAYDAPFPEESYKAGARAWPGLVPTDPDDPGAAEMAETREALAGWEKPAFVLFADSDPITGGARDELRELVPTATDQPDVWVEDAGHFLQEDAGEAVAEHVVAFVDRTPRG